MRTYREVPAHLVPNARVALRAADLACSILCLPGLRVRFFLPATDHHARGDAAMADAGRLIGDWSGHALANERDIAGLTYGLEEETIWVRADLDLEDIIEVVLHEAQHAADFRDKGGIRTIEEREAREYAAVRFASEWLRRIENANPYLRRSTPR